MVNFNGVSADDPLAKAVKLALEVEHLRDENRLLRIVVRELRKRVVRIIDGEKFEVVFDGGRNQQLLRDYSFASSLSDAKRYSNHDKAAMTAREIKQFHAKHGRSYYNNQKASKHVGHNHAA